MVYPSQAPQVIFGMNPRNWDRVQEGETDWSKAVRGAGKLERTQESGRGVKLGRCSRFRT